MLIEAWRRDYNTERPHESLGWKTPSEYVSALGGAAPPSAETYSAPCTNPVSDLTLNTHTAP